MNKKQWCACLLMASAVLNASAQNIDLNMTGRQEAEVNEPDYIGWAVNQVPSESKTLSNGLVVTVAATGNATHQLAESSRRTVLLDK